jgi:peptidoglycan/LPS O-acetylase OafA/YrhL
MRPDDVGRVPVTDAQRQRRVRLDSLTGLRFLAAFTVFGHHVSTLVDKSGFRHVRSLMRTGPTGVSFFFVLSGFVLFWSRRDRDPTESFYARRFARVWPAHAFTWIVGLAVAFWEVRGLFLKSSVINLLLLQSWIPEQHWYYSVNVVSWSLSDEMFFYLLFPLLVLALVRLTPNRARTAAIVVALAAVALQLVLYFAGGSHPDLRFYLMYVFPPTRLLEFMLGALLARSFHALPQLPLRVAIALAGTAILAASTLPEPLRWDGMTIVPFALVIVAAAQADVAGRRTVWSTRAAVLLGTWSFGFYLVHQLVIRSVDKLGVHPASTPLAALLIFAVLAVSIALSIALYELVERPAEHALRGRLATTRTVPALEAP